MGKKLLMNNRIGLFVCVSGEQEGLSCQKLTYYCYYLESICSPTVHLCIWPNQEEDKTAACMNDDEKYLKAMDGFQPSPGSVLFYTNSIFIKAIIVESVGHMVLIN